MDKNLKVFDDDGDFLHTFKVDHEGPYCIYDVTTDHDNNVYVLCQVKGKYRVCNFGKFNNMHCNFVVYGLRASYLTVVENTSKQVLVLGAWDSNFVVNVYKADGTFTRSFPADNQFARKVDPLSSRWIYPHSFGTPLGRSWPS